MVAVAQVVECVNYQSVDHFPPCAKVSLASCPSCESAGTSTSSIRSKTTIKLS